MLDYEEMKNFVKKTLEDANAIHSANPKHHFRDRFMHSVRVYGWCKRIVTDLECNPDVLYTAAIFHDVGYALGKSAHALSSAQIFEAYAQDHGFSKEFTNQVSECIQIHSDKHMLGHEELSNEAILLMEADLLDEEGALGFVWDFMAIANDPGVTYYESLDAIRHSLHILDQDYMITPKAREIWEKKKKLVLDFTEDLRSDLFEGEEI